MSMPHPITIPLSSSHALPEKGTGKRAKGGISFPLHAFVSFSETGSSCQKGKMGRTAQESKSAIIIHII